jgi:hypothetical protein
MEALDMLDARFLDKEDSKNLFANNNGTRIALRLSISIIFHSAIFITHQVFSAIIVCEEI